MAQQNESGGCSLAHMRVIEDVSGLSLSLAAASYVAPGSVAATDGFPSYRSLGSLGFDHQPLVMEGVDRRMPLRTGCEKWGDYFFR